MEILIGWTELMLAITAFGIIVVGGGVSLRARTAKDRHEELQDLANVRKDRIELLEEKQMEQEREIADLRAEVRVLKDTFTQGLIDGVVDGIKEAIA